MVNSQASIITINTLINHRMTSLQKNTYQTLTIHWMFGNSSMMFPETARFSGRVVHLDRVNSGREDEYDRYDDRQERLEQANFRRDVLSGRYDRILGIIFGDDDDLFL